MPNVGALLKQEMARIARKESRAEIQATKKASTQHRRSIATLRRQVTDLQRQVLILQRRVPDRSRSSQSFGPTVATATSASTIDGNARMMSMPRMSTSSSSDRVYAAVSPIAVPRTSPIVVAGGGRCVCAG